MTEKTPSTLVARWMRRNLLLSTVPFIAVGASIAVAHADFSSTPATQNALASIKSNAPVSASSVLTLLNNLDSRLSEMEKPLPDEPVTITYGSCGPCNQPFQWPTTNDQFTVATNAQFTVSKKSLWMFKMKLKNIITWSTGSTSKSNGFLVLVDGKTSPDVSFLYFASQMTANPGTIESVGYTVLEPGTHNLALSYSLMSNVTLSAYDAMTVTATQISLVR